MSVRGALLRAGGRANARSPTRNHKLSGMCETQWNKFSSWLAAFVFTITYKVTGLVKLQTIELFVIAT